MDKPHSPLTIPEAAPGDRDLIRSAQENAAERPKNNDGPLRAGIVFFWAAYFSIVAITNICDGLKVIDVLPADWKFASGNVGLMFSVTKLYATPFWLTAIMFAGVVLWEVLGAMLLWQSFGARASARFSHSATRAFTVTIALSCGFLLADEIFLAYSLVAGSHMHLLIAQLVSWHVVTRSN